MYWFLTLIALFLLLILYWEIRSQLGLRRYIDVRTGKPIPGFGFLANMYWMIRTRRDVVFAERVKEIGLKYGTYANYTMRPSVAISDPEEIKNILKKLDDFPKQTDRRFEHIQKIIGPYNLLSINNPKWHDDRALLNRAFISNTVFFEPMSKKINMLMTKWATKKTDVLVGHDLQKLTLDILATCIFGMDFDTLNGKLAEPLIAYNESIRRVFNPLRFVFPWVNKLPISWNTKLERYLNGFDQYCWEIMSQAKEKMAEKNGNNTDSKNESLSLIEMMYENGLSEDTIRDNVSLFFLAGHETTATTLSWMMSILVKHPDILEKARKEVYDKVPNELTYDALKDLPYIEGLIKETLRLYPPAFNLRGRHPTTDITIGNVRVPAKTILEINLIAMGYDPKTWGDPLVVRPERWYPENITKEQRTAWLPFSYGPRVCIGMNFSLVEQKIFMVHLLKTFKDLKLTKESEIKSYVGGFTYHLDYDKFAVQFVNS